MSLVADRQYLGLPRPSRGLRHRFGRRVFLHSLPYPMSVLRGLCSPETTQPVFNQMVEALYDFLLGQVSSLEFETQEVVSPTRMQTINSEGVYRGEAIRRDRDFVIVDIARAGILPANRFFVGLHHFVEPSHIRMDHVFMSRATNDDGQVIGVNFSGSKIGGPVAGRTVIIPDPMGATGSSLLTTLDLYRNQPGGPPKRFIAVNLVVTPEYLRRVTAEAPDLHVHAIRLDRGLSDPAALDLVPGERPDLEHGLNDHQYIIPGAEGSASSSTTRCREAPDRVSGELLMDETRLQTLISEDCLQARVRELGHQIRKDYGDRTITCIAVLKGSFLFLADLVRAIGGPVRIEFLGVSSYHGGTQSSGAVAITQDLKNPIESQDCLVVEDIVDTGRTLGYLLRLLEVRKPRSLKVCSLLDKPANRLVELPVDYAGFVIPDDFAVGYGLDLGELYRNLPYIAVYSP